MTTANATTMTITPDGSGGLSVNYTPVSAGSGNGCICYNWSPSTQLPNWNAALAAVKAGTAGARARIICFGDSTTQGTITNDNNAQGKAWPNKLAVYMATYDTTVGAHYANFMGLNEESSTGQFSITGTTNKNIGYFGPGNVVWFINTTGDTVTWTPESGRISGRTFDRFDILLGEQFNSSPITIACVGTGGTQTNTVTPAAGGQFQKFTVTLTADVFSSVTITQTGTHPNIIHAGMFWNRATPAIEVYNSGVGGSESGLESGIMTGSLACVPQLALVDYCLNDMLHDTVTLSQSITNLTAFITDLQAANCDVILVIPHPFGLNPMLTPQYTISQFITAVYSLAVSKGVGVIDLNSTYSNNISAYASIFISGGVHPNANGYSDMGQRIAATLTGTAQTFPLSASYSMTYPPNTSFGGYID